MRFGVGVTMAMGLLLSPEAVMVLGCDSATFTVQQALRETECQVVQAMRMTGITNAAVSFRFPMTVKLEAVLVLQDLHTGAAGKLAA